MIVRHAIFPPLDNNCYLICDEATNCSALIDCSFWNGDMEALIGDTDLQYILLTHGHFDHIGGVAEVKKRYGAKVVVSAKDADMLTSPVRSLAAFTGGSQTNTEPDLLVGEGDTLNVGNISVRVFSTPGHTKGSVCYVAEDCLFTGDTLFCESCGRTDFPGGSQREMLRSLKRLAMLPGDYKVYPGHDELSTLSHEIQFNPMMQYGLKEY